MSRIIDALTQTDLTLWHMIAAFFVSQLLSYWTSRRSEYREDHRHHYSDFIDSTVPFELSIRALAKGNALVVGEGEAFERFQENIDRQIVSARKLLVYAGLRERREIRQFIAKMTAIKNLTRSGILAEDFAAFSSDVQDAILLRDKILR